MSPSFRDHVPHNRHRRFLGVRSAIFSKPFEGRCIETPKLRVLDLQPEKDTERDAHVGDWLNDASGNVEIGGPVGDETAPHHARDRIVNRCDEDPARFSAKHGHDVVLVSKLSDLWPVLCSGAAGGQQCAGKCNHSHVSIPSSSDPRHPSTQRGGAA